MMRVAQEITDMDMDGVHITVGLAVDITVEGMVDSVAEMAEAEEEEAMEEVEEGLVSRYCRVGCVS